MSELRFVAKKIGEGRTAHWRVYDRLRGGFPIRRPEFPGLELTQRYTEKEAAQLAQRLTDIAGYMPVGGRPRTLTRTSASSPPEPDDDGTETEPAE